jgi:hypothetical protein
MMKQNSMMRFGTARARPHGAESALGVLSKYGKSQRICVYPTLGALSACNETFYAV